MASGGAHDLSIVSEGIENRTLECGKCKILVFETRRNGHKIVAFSAGVREPRTWVVPEQSPPCRADAYGDRR